MGRRHVLHHVLIMLLVLLMCLVVISYGSRQTQVFKMKPNSKAKPQALLPQSLFGFLPKAVPYPPSAPSRNHNGIELHSSLLGKGKP
ncbi:hypothetical protein S245_018381 [Arachis hypogaea]|nr:uncharacterized protein DS421_5g168370 [Arachis hypogaea]